MNYVPSTKSFTALRQEVKPQFVGSFSWAHSRCVSEAGLSPQLCAHVFLLSLAFIAWSSFHLVEGTWFMFIFWQLSKRCYKHSQTGFLWTCFHLFLTNA